VLLSFVAAAAQAHARLEQATPADGSNLKAAPSEVILRFSEAARLTAAWIQREGGVREKLHPLPERLAPEISVALPPLTPGNYVLTWRVVGDDGHILPGQLRFTLLSTAATARPSRP
jgi:methionine-rich copper-binding protein CopC